MTEAISPLLYIIALTFGAGLAIPAGAAAAAIESIKPDWLEQELRHFVFAFGGGALLSAVALVLVPQSLESLSALPVALFFITGGIGFMLVDILFDSIDTPATQLMAMLSDYVPESIALGSALAMGDNSGLLLAVLIALQNLPESFNGYRELRDNTGYRPRRLMMIFSLSSFFGPLAGIAGYFWLSKRPEAMAAIMLLASGGILYSVFQDIAPQAKLEKHWAPPLGAVLGFCFGLIGHILITL